VPAYQRPGSEAWPGASQNTWLTDPPSPPGAAFGNAGGVRASNGARHVDYTLDALVERCLERLGGRLEQLWA